MIQQKIKTREELVKLRQEWREEGLIVGFTSGAFDLLHCGHVEYLEKAKGRCDILIVGVNSDRSIQRYKGSERPIVPENQRVKIVAALESVDYVFLFDERRNQTNIETLQPDYYIKAGDYSIDQLTSRQALKPYGGEVLLLPIETRTSTSALIERIKTLNTADNHSVIEYQKAVYFPSKTIRSKPAIFLDRDGTINVDRGYLNDPEKLELLPNALEGMKKLQNMGYRLVIITNQGGIGLGYYRKEDFYRVNRKMFQLLAPKKVMIDKIYFCPHSLAEDCDCRKPKTGLIELAKKDLNIDLAHSYLIGDTTSDIRTGKNAHLRTILVRTGKEGRDGEYSVEPDYCARDLLDAADWILQQERKS